MFQKTVLMKINRLPTVFQLERRAKMADLIVGLSSFLFTVYVLFGLAAGISWPF